MTSRRPNTPRGRPPGSIDRVDSACGGFARGPALFLAAGAGGLVLSGLMFLGFLGPAVSASGGGGSASWKILLLISLMVILAALQMVRVARAISRLRDRGPLSGPVRWPDSGEDQPSNEVASTSASPAEAVRQPRTDPYQCPACGARIQAGDGVSPKGDVKCPYCAGWFNIHEP